MTRAPLAGSDLYDWIALRLVSSGGIAATADRWFDAGRRVPGYVADTLADLRGAGLVMVIDPDVSGLARAALTDAGIVRYDVLCQQRQRAQQVAESVVSGCHGRQGPLDKCAVRCVELPLTSLDPVTGHNPQLSAAGCTQYAQLRGAPGGSELRAPDPRSSCPVPASAPGDQPDPTPRPEAASDRSQVADRSGKAGSSR